MLFVWEWLGEKVLKHQKHGLVFKGCWTFNRLHLLHSSCNFYGSSIGKRRRKTTIWLLERVCTTSRPYGHGGKKKCKKWLQEKKFPRTNPCLCFCLILPIALISLFFIFYFLLLFTQFLLFRIFFTIFYPWMILEILQILPLMSYKLACHQSKK